MDAQEYQEAFQKAWNLRNSGQYEEVLGIAESHLALAQEAEDQAAQALFVKLYAQVHSDQGEHREALKYYKQLERLYIDLEDKPKQMHTLRHIGATFGTLQEFECAEKCLVQVIEAYETEAPNALEKANTHREYALALEGLNRDPEAKIQWQKAKDIYEQLWIPEGVEECEEHLE